MKRAPKTGARPNISGEIASHLRAMIFDGRLAGGERVNEVRLAESLGISRTPLREALMSLVAEEALHVIPRRGFFVRPLTSEELAAIYPIRQILDPEALRLSGLPDERRLQSLERLNEKIRAADDVEARITLDDRWHLELIANCPNPVLIDLIRQFIQRTRRYEFAYLRERRHTTTAYDQHREIIRALRSRDLERACDELRQNLTSGQQPILQWLRERNHEEQP